MNRDRLFGRIAAAFGIGLFIACLFPEKFIVILLAAMLICTGVFLSRQC